MEITKTIPAHNPADENTLDGLNNVLTDKIAMHIQNVMPGIVQSYNTATNRAVIKPAITGVASQGQKVPKEVLYDIPVLRLSGGGSFISFPIEKGNTGWLIACDRNISIFKQSLEESAPNDYRKHKFEDSFFIPDSINGAGTNDLTIDAKDNNLALATTANLKINGTSGITGTYTVTNGTKITVTKGIITSII